MGSVVSCKKENKKLFGRKITFYAELNIRVTCNRNKYCRVIMKIINLKIMNMKTLKFSLLVCSFSFLFFQVKSQQKEIDKINELNKKIYSREDEEVNQVYDWGFKVTMVSTIDIGAGSVEVSARPILPNTRSTSGNFFNSPSMVCRIFPASVNVRPGNDEGMYKMLPSFSGGMNSLPNL